jgi:nucleotide-binding universal stress UspA family protein
MNVLVPIDGSDTSERALRFAAGFARRYDGDVHAVHITDVDDDESDALVAEAERILAEEGIEDDPAVAIDVRVSQTRYAEKVGQDVLDMVEESDYDHVVMGHHEDGLVGKLVLGSAAKTVVEGTEVPVTVVP